jgi:hypothetical protein
MKNDKTDTPRTDAVFWKFHTHDDIVNLARDLERELAISLENQCKAQAEVERLKAQLSRAVAIGEALSSELYFPDFVNELNAFKASLSSPSSL